MDQKDLQILLVTDDGELVVALGHAVMAGLSANLTISDNLEQAGVLAASNTFDVILVTQRLSDGTGLSLALDCANGSDTPVILLDDALDAERTLTALRLGAADLFSKPYDMPRLIGAIRRAAERRQKRQKAAGRALRLRRISSRLVKDRRELRERVDLICRDLVQAYHRLAQKVVTGRAADEPALPPIDWPE